MMLCTHLLRTFLWLEMTAVVYCPSLPVGGNHANHGSYPFASLCKTSKEWPQNR
jgi:hypothetical protein